MKEPTPQPSDPGSRLDAIATRYSLLEAAHRQSASSSAEARNSLVLRYRTAIRRYLGGVLRDDAAADEVAQEVVVKLLQGAFAGARASRGRFRDYLRVSVRNAALQYLRRADRQRAMVIEPIAEDAASDDDWVANWQRTLLESAQHTLREFQKAHPGNVYATVLQLAQEFPDDDGARMTERLRELTGQNHQPEAVRKQLSRARRKFTELLLAEVKQTLDATTPERVIEELNEVGLMPFVRDFLPAELQRVVGERP